MFFALFMLIQLSSASVSDCDAKDFGECAIDTTCIWYSWKPARCQNDCSQINVNECTVKAYCKRNEDNTKCIDSQCNEAITEAECLGIVACAFKEKCWDESCVSLQAQIEKDCPREFCIWSDQRSLCYDKRCSDYETKKQCEMISFCEWYKYKCIGNGNGTIPY